MLVPELCRGLEMFIGLLLPIVVYCALPAYSKFRQAPDDSDVKNEIHRSGIHFLFIVLKNIKPNLADPRELRVGECLSQVRLCKAR